MTGGFESNHRLVDSRWKKLDNFQSMSMAGLTNNFDDSVFNDGFASGDVTGEMALMDTFEIGTLSETVRRIAVLKSEKSLGSTGAKIRRRAYRQRGNYIDNNAALSSMQFQKEVRGRSIFPNGENKLFAFPSFDKCDALLFLPSTLIRHLNSADIPSAAKLLHLHLAPQCGIHVPIFSSSNITVMEYLKFNEKLAELLPDAIMCVHTTKVVGSQIRALIYMKGTACKSVYSSVASRMTLQHSHDEREAVYKPFFGMQRAESLQHAIDREHIPSTDQSRLRVLAQTDADADLLLYVRIEMVLTIDELTKKITHISVADTVTSIRVLAENLQ